MKPIPTHIGYIPVEEKPWRVICRDGSFMKGKDGKSLRFDGEINAQKWLKSAKKEFTKKGVFIMSTPTYTFPIEDGIAVTMIRSSRPCPWDEQFGNMCPGNSFVIEKRRASAAASAFNTYLRRNNRWETMKVETRSISKTHTRIHLSHR